MSRSREHLNCPNPGQAELRQRLEQTGWRFTRQRAAVFDCLRSAHSHPTAEDVYSEVRRQIPHISLATVYKALDALVDCRLAVKIPDAHGPTRYDGRCDSHYHLRCVKTGRVEDLPTPFDPDLLAKLDKQLAAELRRRGYEIVGYRLELLGEPAG